MPYTVGPNHRESLKGSLATQVKRAVAAEEEWQQAREAAWREAVSGFPTTALK